MSSGGVLGHVEVWAGVALAELCCLPAAHGAAQPPTCSLQTHSEVAEGLRGAGILSFTPLGVHCITSSLWSLPAL